MKPIDVTVAALCAASALAPAPALAQAADAWQFDGALYLYLPSVDGTTRFGNGGGSDATVDVAKVLESLNATFQASFEARRGQWGGYTDFVYVNFSHANSSTRDLAIGGIPLPVDVSAATDFRLKGSAWALAGLYRAVADPASPLDVIAGARLLDIKQTLAWQLSGNVGQFPVQGQARTQEASIHSLDAIVGVKGRVALGASRFYVPYYFDVGTGDADLTWQAMAGVGYSFGALSVVASYRYLDYRFKNGTPFETLNFSGPLFAAVYRW